MCAREARGTARELALPRRQAIVGTQISSVLSLYSTRSRRIPHPELFFVAFSVSSVIEHLRTASVPTAEALRLAPFRVGGSGAPVHLLCGWAVCVCSQVSWRRRRRRCQPLAPPALARAQQATTLCCGRRRPPSACCALCHGHLSSTLSRLPNSMQRGNSLRHTGTC